MRTVVIHRADKITGPWKEDWPFRIWVLLREEWSTLLMADGLLTFSGILDQWVVYHILFQ